MSSRNYIGKFSTCQMLIATVSSVMRGFFPLFVIIRLPVFCVCQKTRFFWQRLFYHTPKYLLLILLFIFSETKLIAQDKLSNEGTVYYADNVINEKDEEKGKNDLSFVYDEIPVLLMVDDYGNYDLDVIYTNNNLLYVNVEDLFRILMIPCAEGQRGDNLAGFIEDESNTYFIDYKTKQIKVGEKISYCKNKMVKEMGMLYLESSLLAEAFGISLTFNYRSLSVILKSNFELPVIKQLRLEKMRKSLTHIKGETIADTVFNRNYHLLKFGAIDWALSSSQTWNSAPANQFRVGVGTELLYGEANVSVSFNNQYKFDSRQLNYLWRWVDNDKKIIKQAQIGKISNQSIAFINSPIVGAVIRNTPTTVRKATGHYTVSDYTEPNWTVELYINDAMVNYTKADASGMYFFEVPNVYGFTTLKLKFYGPMGEERIEERTINIPYTFMPEKEFEYGITSGVIQDSSLSRYAKVEANYGVSKIVTIGGGLEYLSSIQNSPYIPFVKTSIQPLGKLTLIGEYAHGVRTKGLINYSFLKNASIKIDYTKYVKDQQATQFSYLEKRRIILSLPYRFKKISGFSKLNFTQYVYETLKYNQTNIMLSAYYKQFSANSTTQLNWTDNKPAYITSNSSLSWRLKRGFVFRPSSLYNVSQHKLTSFKLNLEKRIPNGHVSVGYERNISNRNHIISVGFKYDLSFARTNSSTAYSDGHISSSESANGSFIFGSGNKKVYTDKNSSVGKGGISIYPFLDLNNNGIFDPSEKMVKLSSVKVYGGKVVFSEKDSIIRIPNLNAFLSYNIEFSDNDLDNIAWRFKNKIYSILVDPNQYKRVDIPILSVGEVSGMVYLDKENKLDGLGRITVQIYNPQGSLVAETLSESDGYFTYLGLKPGDYTVRVDEKQLEKLGYQSAPLFHKLHMKKLIDGDIVDGLELVLQSPAVDTITSIEPDMEEKRLAIQNTDAKEKAACLIQVGEFEHKADAIAVQNRLIEALDCSAVIVSEGDIFKVLIGVFESRKEAGLLATQLLAMGYSDALIILVEAYGETNKYERMNRDVFTVQLGAFAKKSNALVLRSHLSWISDKTVVIEHEGGLYKVRFNYFHGRKAARIFMLKLLNQGISELFIVPVKTKHTFNL
ncbi:MAG: SPOR domain-containing protein [Labilibaculum sp.]|nr:SPOR domain-containing protein [Labilibaculum sp.]